MPRKGTRGGAPTLLPARRRGTVRRAAILLHAADVQHGELPRRVRLQRRHRSLPSCLPTQPAPRESPSWCVCERTSPRYLQEDGAGANAFDPGKQVCRRKVGFKNGRARACSKPETLSCTLPPIPVRTVEGRGFRYCEGCSGMGLRKMPRRHRSWRSACGWPTAHDDKLGRWGSSVPSASHWPQYEDAPSGFYCSVTCLWSTVQKPEGASALLQVTVSVLPFLESRRPLETVIGTLVGIGPGFKLWHFRF